MRKAGPPAPEGKAPGPSSTAPATASPAVEVPPNVPPGTTPVPRFDASSLDPSQLGTDQDYQLVRALDLLRGVVLFKKLAAQ